MLIFILSLCSFQTTVSTQSDVPSSQTTFSKQFQILNKARHVLILQCCVLCTLFRIEGVFRFLTSKLISSNNDFLKELIFIFRRNLYIIFINYILELLILLAFKCILFGNCDSAVVKLQCTAVAPSGYTGQSTSARIPDGRFLNFAFFSRFFYVNIDKNLNVS